MTAAKQPDGVEDAATPPPDFHLAPRQTCFLTTFSKHLDKRELTGSTLVGESPTRLLAEALGMAVRPT